MLDTCSPIARWREPVCDSAAVDIQFGSSVINPSYRGICHVTGEAFVLSWGSVKISSNETNAEGF